MGRSAYDYMNWAGIEAVVYAEEASPKDIMAPRITPDGILLQGFFPEGKEASVLIDDKEFPMEMEDEAGYFAALVDKRKLPKDYRFRVIYETGEALYRDPYRFPCQITEEEENAFLAGVWYEAFRKLGSHPMEIDGIQGTYFAVWAPNAMRVSIVGDFNLWDGKRLPMHRMPKSGIFELFVPGLPEGTVYKYELKLKNGELKLKSDPYAAAAEKPQGDASAVADPGKFCWDDEEWMKKRKDPCPVNGPMSIYETSLPDWKPAEELVSFLKDNRFTHVEFHPVMEYLDEAADGYSTTSYFAPTARFGTPEDFQKLVCRLHKEGIGVILDWTPAQFPKNEAGLSMFDGTALYERQNPAEAVHPMWDTMLYNYGSPMVRDFLISNAVFWTEVYHVDGLRLDDVDAMLYLDYGRSPGHYTPNIYGSNENLQAVDFLKELNSVLKKRNPGILLIAQEDGLWPELTGPVSEEQMGFDYKWSGGWTSDLLKYLSMDSIYRKDYHDQLTLSMLYAYSEHYILTLGSRDVGSLAAFRDRIWGDRDQKAAQLREAYAYLFLHPGCKMIAPDKSLPEELALLIRDLNSHYLQSPALYEKDDDYEGFEWIQLMKYEENILTFMRKSGKEEETLLAVCNFAAVPRKKYPVGVPFHGKYKEILNTDDKRYGGSNQINPRAKTSTAVSCDEREESIKVNLAPLSIAIFRCTPA